MFWGLILEPSKRYTQTVSKPFHLSMASLDFGKSGDDPVQVMLYYQNCNYLLCTLQKDKVLQMTLDLNFQEGSKISFSTNGSGHVHLTGYVIPDSEDDFDEMEQGGTEDSDSFLEHIEKKKRPFDAPANEKKLKKPRLANLSDSLDYEEDNSSNDELSDIEFDDSSEDDDDSIDENVMEDDEDDEEEEDEEEKEEELEEKPVESKKLTKNQKKKLKKLKAKENEKITNGKTLNESKEQSKQVNGDHESLEKDKKLKNKNKKKNEEKIEQPMPQQKKKVIEGGIQVEDIKLGSGPIAKPGKFISVYYIGRLKNGKKFDQTVQGDGFKFRLGSGEVIKGWDLGIAGMKVGGKRRLIIPPALAYGNKGSPPVIPANSTLNFEVELKALH